MMLDLPLFLDFLHIHLLTHDLVILGKLQHSPVFDLVFEYVNLEKYYWKNNTTNYLYFY